MFLEAKGMTYEERNITQDETARRELIDRYGSNETPTLVIVTGADEQVFSDLDPESLDQLLSAVSSSNEGESGAA
jgi:glutaredoxin